MTGVSNGAGPAAVAEGVAAFLARNPVRVAAAPDAVEPVIDVDLAAVWSAARAASANLAVAEDVTVAVMSRRRRDPPANRRTLVVAAVRQAVAIAPCAPLAALAADERESLALARLAGLDVDEIADIVGSDAAIVRRRLTNGLRALAEQSACAAMPRRPAVRRC